MNNKYPQISFVFDRRKVASTTIRSSVDMRICHNYKQRFIATGIRLYANQWKKGKIVNCPDIMQVSQVLDRMLADVRQIILDMEKEGTIDISAIPDRLRQLNTPRMDFIDFCNQRAGIRKFGKRKDTQQRYDRFIRLFREWGKIREFEDINDKSIISYDKYLEGTGMKPYSKWNNYHRFLNSFIMDAIDEGYIRRNPYRWVNIEKDKQGKGLERCLTPEEFHKLKVACLCPQTVPRPSGTHCTSHCL